MFDGLLDREIQFISDPAHEHTYDLTLEERWKTEYEKRRDQWGKKVASHQISVQDLTVIQAMNNNI